MRHIVCYLLVSAVGVASLGCGTAMRPLRESVTIRVSAADSTQPVRFAVNVDSGPAELRASRIGMRGVATSARLEATTPAVLTLHPGTRAAVFQVLSGGDLEVSARSASVLLGASGDRVTLVESARGLEIRSF